MALVSFPYYLKNLITETEKKIIREFSIFDELNSDGNNIV